MHQTKENMKISNYLIIKQIGTDYILFSTISKKIIKVSRPFYDEMRNLDLNNLKNITSQELQYLIDSYFLIKDDVDEKNIVESMLDIDRLNQEIFSSYIAFSTMCNFACVYCYEEGQTQRCYVMDKEEIEKTINWYKQVLIKNRYKKCKITLFGGEPLLHIKLIKFFINQIGNFTRKNKIGLKIAIITNGYLLSQDIVDFLVSYGLEEIQITLDGIGKVHDERRPLRNGGPTFEKIINNIKQINKFNGRFLFRVSFDNDNIKYIKELLNYLKNVPIKNNYQIYLAPIHQTTNQSETACSFCSKNTTENIEEIINHYKDLYGYMSKIGLSIPKYITNGPCMTVSKDTVLIDPHGKLFKCVEMIGLDNLSVGNVKNNLFNQKLSSFIGRPNFKKCIDEGCKYVCLCGGGCLMKSLLKDSTLKNLDCQYKLFDDLIPYLLELNYGNK